MLALAPALTNSCTQQVVIVSSGSSGGAGGTGDAGGTQRSTGGNDASLCATPDQAPPLLCGSTAAVGSGEPFQCDKFCDDTVDNTWTSECTDGGCDCLFNDQLRCSCTFGPLDGVCSENCCPDPWQQTGR